MLVVFPAIAFRTFDVVEVLGRGYSYIAMIDAEIADIERAERYRREDHQHDVFI